MLTTTHSERRRLDPADVALILKCGTPQEAEELFTDVRDAPIKLVGATVVEADQNVIRVTWDDGFKPSLAPFHFNFDLPLTAIPHPGDKIDIVGTYSSYSREPFRITMKNSSFGFTSAKVIVPNGATNKARYRTHKPLSINHSQLFSAKTTQKTLVKSKTT
jgi:hypothetical protein